MLEKVKAVVVTAIVDEGLGNSSYVVDLGNGDGLVVDPERDPRPYLAELEKQSLRPRFVVETHLHADFVSGGRELVAAGAQLLAPAGSGLTFPHRPLRDEEEIDTNGLLLRVIATPGHTPEHLSYMLLDGSAPIGLFSGGTLMAGGVARTDLLTPDQTEPLARAAYRSIRERLLTLPDDLVVYPTHGAGSFCSIGSGSERTTTIGRERSTNPLLAGDADSDTFVQRLLGGYGSYPHYFLELRDVNRQGPRVYGASPPVLRQLSVADFDRAVADGAEVIDVRDVELFAAGHVPGALSNSWRDRFATWLGWLVPRDRPLVFVIDADLDRQDLMWAVFKVGFENVIGELGRGMTAWVEAGRSVSRIPIVDHLPEVRAVVDVRQASEFEQGHFPQALHVELGSIAESAGEIPKGKVLVHCGRGERAMTAASLLLRSGHQDVMILEEGPERLGQVATGE